MKFLLAVALLSSSLFANGYKVLGIGCPCVDYTLRVDDAYLNAIPLQKGTWKEIDYQALNFLIRSSNDPMIHTGGSSANTIKGLAQLCVPCALVGNVGLDCAGEMLIKAFSQYGVETLFSKKNLNSSQIVCLVTPDGERSFCSYVQAEKNFFAADLHPEYFKSIDLMHLDAYSIKNGYLIEKAMQLCKQAHAKISFDLANPQLVSLYRERIWALLTNYVDILFANEEEVFQLTHLPPKEAAEFLKNFCKVVVVKVGPKGCFAACEKQCIHVPAIATDVVDTTGAGDLFASGFLYGYLKGLDLETCARFGNMAGSAVIESYGAEISDDRWRALQAKFDEIHCKQSPSSL